MDLHKRMQQAVVQTVANLLETMIPMAFEPVQFQDSGLRLEGDHLMGMIQVNGKLTGSIAVSVPFSLAAAMASAMLEEEIDELNDEVYETVAEMINIIAGGIKTSLSQQEEVFSLGLPQVLELSGGRELPADTQRVVVPIKTDKGLFVVMSTLFESGAHEQSA